MARVFFIVTTVLPEDFQIQTRRLILAFPSERAFPALRSAAEHEQFTRFLGFAPSRSETAFLHRLGDAHRLWRAGERYTFDAWHAEGRCFVGRVRLSRAGGGVWRLGYFVVPRFWRLGFGGEMGVAAADLAFTVLGATELAAKVAAKNVASAALLRRLGLVSRGAGEGGPVGGALRFAVSRDDWLRRHAANAPRFRSAEEAAALEPAAPTAGAFAAVRCP